MRKFTPIQRRQLIKAHKIYPGTVLVFRRQQYKGYETIKSFFLILNVSSSGPCGMITYMKLGSTRDDFKTGEVCDVILDDILYDFQNPGSLNLVWKTLGTENIS